MNLPISNRLLACCGFVHPGDRVADIGCDHGYLGIHLLKNGIADSVIAADIREMPLKSAIANSEKFHVQEKMTFFLTNGLKNLPRDFNALVCAGMGGDTIMGILGTAPWLKNPRYHLILQCQTKLPELRRWLYSQGYSIRGETLAEDGSFIYPVMDVVYAPAPPLSAGECYLSPPLLRCGSPLLPAFYSRVRTGLTESVAGLRKSGTESEKLTAFSKALEEITALEETIYGNRV